MARKTSGGFGKVVAVVFTSVVAPVLVHVAVRDSNGDEAPPSRSAAARVSEDPSAGPRPPVVPTGFASQSPASAPPVVTLQVIVQGAGKTPEEALRQALHTALDRAAAALVDAESWASNGAALRASLARDGGDLIRGWRDLGGRKEWKLRGTVYHREVAVDVNREALLTRLRAAQAPGREDGWLRVVSTDRP